MEDIKEFIEMRTIKFRAQVMFPEGGIVLSCDKAEGEWVYGDLHLQSRIPHIHSLGKKYPINPGTVGQFTGLYDKDGREIYEGDIIKYTHEICIEDGPGTYVGAVSFCEGVFCLHEDSDCTVATAIYESEEYGGICVIGNIHDNPEFLTNK